MGGFYSLVHVLFIIKFYYQRCSDFRTKQNTMQNMQPHMFHGNRRVLNCGPTDRLGQRTYGHTKQQEMNM